MARRRSDSNARLRLKSVILPLAVTGVAAIILIVLPLLPIGRRSTICSTSNRCGRIWMGAVTGTMIRDAPWGGHGLGTFGLQFPFYQAQAFSWEWAAPFIPNASFTSYASDYLQLWVETGLFGLLAFGTLIWIVLKRGRALAGDPVALGCWAAVISLLVNAAVAFPLHLPTTLMLFVVLVAVVEGAASQKTVGLLNSAILLRIAIVLLALILCFSAYQSSYHRLVADAALWQADAALESQEWNEAEAAIRTAIQHAPTRLDGQAMLGRLHVERGEYEQALLALDQAQRLGYGLEIYDLKAMAFEASGERPPLLLR
ncbi:MAG: hypothetical protein WKF84_23765 [Pyrinomonadaceae bacterium]